MAVMLPTLAAWSSSGTPPEHPASMHAATRTAMARALCAIARHVGSFRSVCARSRAAAGGRQPRRARYAFNLSGADDG